METSGKKLTLNEINDNVYKLEKKIVEVTAQRERLLSDFVNKLDLKNLHLVEHYHKADELIIKALKFMDHTKQMLLIKARLLKAKEEKNEEGN
jgi:hypothetical protein